MVVQENVMCAYMHAHGCPALLIDDEVKAAKQGIAAHWRDCEGHWYSVVFDSAKALFEVTQS